VMARAQLGVTEKVIQVQGSLYVAPNFSIFGNYRLS
jgi:hypothetical protein